MHSPLEPSNFYHFYNRGNNRENIFKNADNYNYFIFLMEKYLVPIVDFYSYCLLPNHFHLVFKVKDNNLLPERFRKGESKLHQPFSNLFNAYAKAFNRYHKRTGSLFQKHPKKKIIMNEEYLKNLIIYVNINPLHHLISDYKTYKYSSYKELISNKKSFINKVEVIDLFYSLHNFKFTLDTRKMNIELKLLS